LVGVEKISLINSLQQGIGTQGPTRRPRGALRVKAKAKHRVSFD
jgi:hypothetical protein